MLVMGTSGADATPLPPLPPLRNREPEILFSIILFGTGDSSEHEIPHQHTNIIDMMVRLSIIHDHQVMDVSRDSGKDRGGIPSP